MAHNVDYLKDIVTQKATEDMVFSRYRSKKEVGLNILNQMTARLIDLGNGKLGFPMDDVDKTSKNVGLLSQCQGLQAIISLVNDFGLEFAELNEGQDYPHTIRYIMDAILADVVNKLRVNKDYEITEDVDEELESEELFVFDASPYNSTKFNERLSSIETISWVLPTIFQILVMHANNKEVCKWERTLVRIVRYGILYITRAFISGEQPADGGKKGLSIGWNFTSDCQEPSLYFTFTVAECFLDMYNTFQKALEYPYSVYFNQQYGTPIDQEAQKAHRANRVKFINDDRDHAHYPKNKAKHDPGNELVRLFRMINSPSKLSQQDPLEELSVDPGTRFGLLEQQLKKVAKEIWRYVQNDLGDKFFYNDLATTLTENDIKMSTTSDALFNSVYLINIMIDSGLDEVLRLEIAQAEQNGKLEEAEKKRRELDNLLESCQLAVQRAFRTYESLANDSKGYIVDQFLIGFNERFTTHLDIVNDLRKLRMRVCSLLPLLIHTNNVINTYLVQYPQVNMQKYLGYIMDNRLVEKDGEGKEVSTHWIWEKDGYFSGSNYYYVNALKEFYEYYDKYEARYLDNTRDNISFEQETREKHLKELRDEDGEIGKLNAEMDANRDEIERLQKQIAELHAQLEAEKQNRPVENSIQALINRELDQQFLIRLTETFAQAAKAFAPDSVDKTQDEDGAFAAMLAAMLDMIVANCYGTHPKYKKCNAEEYKKNTKYFKEDIRGIVAHNIDDIRNAADHRSNMRNKLD